ncbi:L,D-transpeptidase [Patescibacteria group bacterium]|nr:L,D-transpeptidase [Patescibacteria group bacterium]
MIHGGGSDSDRTAGCIGLSDEDMLWLYEFVPKGTDVIIE